MMEDLSYTNSMVAPLKKLNLEFLANDLNSKYPGTKYEELEVIFSPLHVDDYIIKDNRLIVNFFKVKPNGDNTLINDTELAAYLKEKLEEMLSI